jgi:hypothetical protein
MWGPGQESMAWHGTIFCSKGYGIVYSNPRMGGLRLDFKSKHQ